MNRHFAIATAIALWRLVDVVIDDSKQPRRHVWKLVLFTQQQQQQNWSVYISFIVLHSLSHLDLIFIFFHCGYFGCISACRFFLSFFFKQTFSSITITRQLTQFTFFNDSFSSVFFYFICFFFCFFLVLPFCLWTLTSITSFCRDTLRFSPTGYETVSNCLEH